MYERCSKKIIQNLQKLFPFGKIERDSVNRQHDYFAFNYQFDFRRKLFKPLANSCRRIERRTLDK